jgi:hypothetical protein
MIRDGSVASVKSSPDAVITRIPRLISMRTPSSCATKSRAKRDASSTMTVRTPLFSIRSRSAEKPGRVFRGVDLFGVTYSNLVEAFEEALPHRAEQPRLG